MDFIAVVSIAAVTIWVFIQGYKVVTGTQRESIMALTVSALKAVFIVSVALSFGAANDTVTTYLVDQMPSGIHELITGNSGAPSDEIDRNLGWMQIAPKKGSGSFSKAGCPLR